MNRVYAPLVYWRSPNNVSPDPCFFTSIYGLALLVVYYSLHFPLLITLYVYFPPSFPVLLLFCIPSCAMVSVFTL